MAKLGITIPDAPELIALENEEGLHHVIVCTLWSCYPRMLLAEFGLTLPQETRIRVVDNTADLRYLVIPRRPPGTEGWDEARLAAFVTRDSMIGTGVALNPE